MAAGFALLDAVFVVVPKGASVVSVGTIFVASFFVSVGGKVLFCSIQHTHTYFTKIVKT